MNEKALRVLEYNKIIGRLAEFAGSGQAKERCRALLPGSRLADIRAALRETSDAAVRLSKKGYLSFQGIGDIRGSLKRLEIGGILSTGELLEIAHLLEICERIKATAAETFPKNRRILWTTGLRICGFWQSSPRKSGTVSLLRRKSATTRAPACARYAARYAMSMTRFTRSLLPWSAVPPGRTSRTRWLLCATAASVFR